MSTTATEVVITIPRHTVSGNELRREYKHWAKYKALKTSWEWDIIAASTSLERWHLARLRDAKTKMRVEITVSRQRLLDKDNLYSGCKPVIDALRTLKLIYQDSPKYLDLDVRQIQAPKSSTEIRISEAQ